MSADDERELMKRWVKTWQQAGPELEKIRLEELRNVDTQQAIPSFDSAFRLALRTLPPRQTSGLVELQAWFQKLRP